MRNEKWQKWPDGSASRELTEARWWRLAANPLPPLVPDEDDDDDDDDDGGDDGDDDGDDHDDDHNDDNDGDNDLLLPLPPIHQRVWRPLQGHLVAHLHQT